jgi:hypothetical protein
MRDTAERSTNETHVLFQPIVMPLKHMATTRPDFGCYRLVKAEDEDPFIAFQNRYQLCSGSLVLVGML